MKRTHSPAVVLEQTSSGSPEPVDTEVLGYKVKRLYANSGSPEGIDCTAKRPYASSVSPDSVDTERIDYTVKRPRVRSISPELVDTESVDYISKRMYASPGSPDTLDTEIEDYTVKRPYVTNEEHVNLVCENLISTGKFERLERFLWAIPNMKELGNTEAVLVARCYIAFKNGDFTKLYELLQYRSYSKKYHRQLQYLWRTARYIEAERARGRALGSVGKYRIRRKYPLPYTIWDGECMSYCFREEAREILNTMYKRSPYPTAKEKYAIAQEAKLSVTQVSNWFKNKRQRARAKSTDKKQSLVTTDTRLDTKLTNDETTTPLMRKEHFSPTIIFNQDNQEIEKEEKIMIRRPIPQLPPLFNAPYKRKVYSSTPYHHSYPMMFPMMTKYHIVPTPVLCRVPTRAAHLPTRTARLPPLVLMPSKKLRVDSAPKIISPPYYKHSHHDKLCDKCMQP